MKSSRSLSTTLAALDLAGGLLSAQSRHRSRSSDSVALPERVVPEAPPAEAIPAPPPATPNPSPAVGPRAPVKDPAATPRPTAAKPGKKGEILLNFQGASLTDVLNYLSEAAGFVDRAGSAGDRHRERGQPPADHARRRRSICSIPCSSRKATSPSATGAS